jgi:hypothetical protein
MKRLLIGLVLSLAATVTLAQPQWVLVTSDTDGHSYYTEPTTKRRTGNIVRMWELVDFQKPKAFADKTYSSERVYWQYDCSEGTRQYLQSHGYSGQMGSGVELGSRTRPGEKFFVAPGTASEALLNFACK